MCESHRAIATNSTIIEETDFIEDAPLIKKISEISCATKESLYNDLWWEQNTYCRNINHSQEEHIVAEEKMELVSLCKQWNDAIKYIFSKEFLPKKEHIWYLVMILEKITFSDIKDFTLLKEDKISRNDEGFFINYFNETTALLSNLAGETYDIDFIWWTEYLSTKKAEKKFLYLREQALAKLQWIISNFADENDQQEYLKIKQLAYRTYEMKRID